LGRIFGRKWAAPHKKTSGAWRRLKLETKSPHCRTGTTAAHERRFFRLSSSCRHCQGTRETVFPSLSVVPAPPRHTRDGFSVSRRRAGTAKAPERRFFHLSASCPAPPRHPRDGFSVSQRDASKEIRVRAGDRVSACVHEKNDPIFAKQKGQSRCGSAARRFRPLPAVFPQRFIGESA